jgi:hypothetical protein
MTNVKSFTDEKLWAIKQIPGGLKKYGSISLLGILFRLSIRQTKWLIYKYFLIDYICINIFSGEIQFGSSTSNKHYIFLSGF